MSLTECQRRVVALTAKHQLGHLNSNLNALEVMEDLFRYRIQKDDYFILSMGHAGLALYVMLEKYRGQDAEALLKKHGTQPHLDLDAGILCSTGSLGQGLTVAVGYALAEPWRQVYCLVSDGECAEGCVWEALAFANRARLTNLHVHVNANGQSALSAVDVSELGQRLRAFWPAVQVHHTMASPLPVLHGIHGHYKVITAAEAGSILQPSTSN